MTNRSLAFPGWMTKREAFLPWFLAFWLGLFAAGHGETLPPVPKAHFNDEAALVSPKTVEELNDKLAKFKQETSNDIVVALFKRLDTSLPIRDYTLQVANSWRVGQTGDDHGVVLFVFAESHQMYIQVGRGLEGKLPDALCQRVIDEKLKPNFKAGNYDAGFVAGIDAIIEAIKGPPSAPAESADASSKTIALGVFLSIGLLILWATVRIIRAIWRAMNFDSVFRRRRNDESGNGSWGSTDEASGGGGGDGGFGGGGAGGHW